MYQPPRKPGPPPLTVVNEEEARKKLSQYVYEYLCHHAPKVAEMFRNETQLLGQPPPNPGEAPGFLYNWWIVFWDLYSATPDRRDKENPTQEAKGFMDYQMNPMNSIPGFNPAVGMVPGLPDYYRQAPGSAPSNQASPVPGYQPGFAPQRFPTMMSRPQMGPGQFPRPQFDGRMMPGVHPNNGTRVNFPMNRAMAPGYRGYLDSPTNPNFPPNGMLPNGTPISSTPSMMSSPGPSGGPMPDPNMPPQHYSMMMAQGGMHPGQFPMMGDPTAAGTPTSSSAGPTSVPGMNGAPASVPTNIGGPSSVGSGTMPTSVGQHGPVEGGGSLNSSQLSSLLNGNADGPDMKQSPSQHLAGGVNGGTPQHGPGSHLNQPNGPASAAPLHGPNSVQSQPGAPHSVSNMCLPAAGPHSTPQHNPQMTPTSGAENPNAMEFSQGAPHPGDNDDKEEEISKIKASLIEDFPKTNSYNF